MISVLAQAQSYIANGWNVLPLRAGTKVPATTHGKHDASRDLHTIGAWFAGSDHNIGILTGHASRLLVVDVDPRNGGDASLAELQAKFGELPSTLRARTGGGGMHYYYSLPEDAPVTKDRPNVAGYHGVDLKADGYVVAPPSLHESGLRYEWLEGEMAAAPDWLTTLASGYTSLPKVAPVSREIAQGGRNDSLFRMACGMMRNGLSREAVLSAVTVHNEQHCNPPLDAGELESIVASAFRYEAESQTPINDVFNARRLVKLMDGNARFEPKSGGWYLWTGTHWRRDEDGAVIRLAKQMLDELLRDASAIADEDLRKKRLAAIHRSQSHARIQGAISLAASESGIPIAFGEFDTTPRLLNVLNGTIDLENGKLRPHAREDLITQRLEIEYDPAARCPTFEKFVLEVCADDGELAGYLQTAVGYAATGLTSEQCFFILHGSGANGKSTFLNAIRSVLGSYAKHTPTETLLTRRVGSASNDLIRLAGARLVTASEASADQRMADGLLKQITGDEPVTARYLFKEFVEFQPQFKLFLATNNLPQLDGTDPAIWRRVRMIPFERVFTRPEQDPGLPQRLAAESQGILNWIVDGAKDWFKWRLATPNKVEAATLAYSKEMDPVGQFIDECCVQSAGASVAANNLFARYTSFAANQGFEAMNQTRFGKILSAKGFGKEKRNGYMIRLGLTLSQ